MKVAFATCTDAAVDAHFGWCPRLVVFEVGPGAATLVASHRFPPAVEDGDEDKLGPRLAALEGVALLYTTAIGPSAAGRVRAAGIQLARVDEGAPIDELLLKLHQVMAGSPPPWLRRAMTGSGPRPFDPSAPEEASTP